MYDIFVQLRFTIRIIWNGNITSKSAETDIQANIGKLNVEIF